jgi:hypothetical protein
LNLTLDSYQVELKILNKKEIAKITQRKKYPKFLANQPHITNGLLIEIDFFDHKWIPVIKIIKSNMQVCMIHGSI